MAVDTSDFKNGMHFLMDGDVYTITEFQHVKPGKGGAFVRTRLKNLKSGRTLEKTFRSGERVEPVFVEKVEELAASLKDVVRDKDVIVTMGAGTISAVSHALRGTLRALVGGARAGRRRSRGPWRARPSSPLAPSATSR